MTCLDSGITLLLAFSVEETARYIETLKCYEKKPPTLISGRKEQSFNAQVSITDAGIYEISLSNGE